MNIIKWSGAKIDKPGIYSGVPIDVYHGDLCVGPSISSSGLRTIESKTPLHYYATSYLNPDRADDGPKDHFTFGRAAHLLLLGESGFAEQFAVRPDHWDDWRTKAAQEWRREQQAAGRDVLTDKDVKIIKRIAVSLEKHPLVQQGILQGLVEHTIVCQDRATGVWLKSRPDIVPQADGVLVDLKTAADANPDAILRSVREYAYPMQGALAAMVMKEAVGVAITDFVLVFIEKKEPHAVAISAIDNEWLYWAGRQVRRAIDKFAKCIETNEWPGYDVEATASMPQWLRTRFEDEDKHGLIPQVEAA